MTNTPETVASMFRSLATEIKKHNRSAGPGVWQGDDGFWLRTADFLESHPDSELAQIVVHGLTVAGGGQPRFSQDSQVERDAIGVDEYLTEVLAGLSQEATFRHHLVRELYNKMFRSVRLGDRSEWGTRMLAVIETWSAGNRPGLTANHHLGICSELVDLWMSMKGIKHPEPVR